MGEHFFVWPHQPSSLNALTAPGWVFSSDKPQVMSPGDQARHSACSYFILGAILAIAITTLYAFSSENVGWTTA